MIREKTPAHYTLTMKNRPGEFMKLTKFLSDAGVNVDELRIANFGDTASIEFTAPKDCALPAVLRKARHS